MSRAAALWQLSQYYNNQVNSLTGNEYYKDYASAYGARNPWALAGFGNKVSALMMLAENAKWAKDREIQTKEFNTVKGATKTESYGSSVSKSDLEARGDEARARALAAIEEEEHLLGGEAIMGARGLFGGLGRGK